MVERLLNFIHREWQGLHEAAFLLAASALTSQLLGLWRDRLLASRFGAGQELDVYYAAFRIPDFLYVILVSFVSVTVVLPFILGSLQSGDREKTERLMGGLLCFFLIAVIFSTGLIFILLPILQPLIFPGFDEMSTGALISLSRLLLLSPLFLGLSNLLANITQAYRQFFIYALSPIFYNLGIIFGIWFLEPRLGLNGLAWGVVIGAVLHLLVQLPAIRRHGFRFRLPTKLIRAEIKKIFLISWPRTLTLSTNQLTLMVLVAIGSLMSAGSITVFTFAYNLQSVPLSIVGVSYAVAAFPTLVRHHVGGQRDKFIEQLSRATKHILFWSLPITTLFVVLRAQVVRVILGSGRFDWSDTRLTAAALAMFALSLVAQSLAMLFIRGYYASGKTRTPLLINLLGSVTTVVLALLLKGWFEGSPLLTQSLAGLFRVSAVSGVEILILPLSFTIGSIVSLVLFWFCFERDYSGFSGPLRRPATEIIISSLAAAVGAYGGLQFLAVKFDLNTFWGIFGQGFIAGLFGIFVGISVLYWFKNEELLELHRSLRRRFWQRAETVVPEAEQL